MQIRELTLAQVLEDIEELMYDATVDEAIMKLPSQQIRQEWVMTRMRVKSIRVKNTLVFSPQK